MLFVSDTLRSGRGKEQTELVHALVRDSADAITFLEQHLQTNLSVVSLLGGHSAARTHRAPAGPKPLNVGLAIMQGLERAARASSLVSIVTNARATGLLSDATGRVTGVKYVLKRDGGEEEDQELHADAVVLATGGYSTDRTGLLAEYNSELTKLPSTNAVWRSAGEGVRMGRALGARLALMEYVQVHPTALVDPADPDASFVILAGEALRGDGGILINASGKRFADELTYRDTLTAAINRHGSRIRLPQERMTLAPTAYLVLNNRSASKFGEAIAFYSFKKLARRYANLAEFCNASGIPYDTAAETFKNVSEAASGVREDEFGRKSFAGGVYSVDGELNFKKMFRSSFL